MKRPNGIVPKPARGVYKDLKRMGKGKRWGKIRPDETLEEQRARETKCNFERRIAVIKRLEAETAKPQPLRRGPRILPDLSKQKPT